MEPDTIPILLLRGYPVILDADLAALYGVTTKRLNEQVRRNKDKFPEDFCFQLKEEELPALRSQIATLKPAGRGRHSKYLPLTFTEHGALMAANVLSSSQATKMSIFIIRAFVKQREELSANQVILRRLAEIDKSLLVHDSALRDLYHKLLPLLEPPPAEPRRPIGFG